MNYVINEINVKHVEIFRFLLESDGVTVTLHEDLCAFLGAFRN